MHRSAPRLTRILVCAAVPVTLLVTGCSSGSGDGDKKDKSPSSSSADSGGTSAGSGSGSGKKQTPVVEPAKYAKLPDACKSLSEKTIKALVPSVKVKGGTAGRSTDLLARGSCSWNGLEDKGVKGSQYRWLDVSFLRYDSEEALAVSGAERAQNSYTKEVAKAKAVKGAKNLRTSPAAWVGQQATAVGYELRKTGVDFTYATIVTRTDNVVITLTYNGTGYAGAKPPTAGALTTDAVKAAKEAVASVATANRQPVAAGG
ncbi:DUF3558 domain-containing protein [Streptomyces sp. NPDC004609]|uniref:DUF3558 domain-containing protein n=1 Tax=Streptomyces sp. NPDC004609 TaxID=3364704 RepID=UPI0036CC5497